MTDRERSFDPAEDKGTRAADVGRWGARVIHRQLARAQLDTDYGRELEEYVGSSLELQVGAPSDGPAEGSLETTDLLETLPEATPFVGRPADR